MRHTLVLIFVLASISTIFSQNSDLFIPIDVQKAYENGTRSYDGRVSENYWINHSEYKIDVELFPDSNLIIGSESVTYLNNSPESLSELVIRLYQNITKPGAKRDLNLYESALTKGIEITKLKIRDELITLPSKYVYISGTNMSIRLEKELPPNSTINLELNWSYTISARPMRTGNYGGEFFIAYWYPQIAVYDDLYGWDEIDYGGTVEFYNDFNNYDFKITVPDNYVVWATGELQNQESVFQSKIIKKIEEAKNSDETVNIITLDDHQNEHVTLRNEIGKNTWNFKASNVPDVAWATSNNYNWDASSIEVENGRRVLTAAIYPDSVDMYKNAALYARETIKYLSHESPGYPYPWSHTTAFCNKRHGGGMEFPMMQNNGVPSTIGGNVGLIFHEILHSYFPFHMGINERRAAWMEEGWASFFPRRVVEEFDSTYDYQAIRVAEYLGDAGNNYDMPMMVPSFMFVNGGSRNNFYSRPANAYEELRVLLGDELFNKALLEYMNRWHEKHPIPYDFFFTFNDFLMEDLSWFWKPWFFEFGYPDLGIESIISDTDKTTITINKVGNIPTRIFYKVTFEDDSFQEFSESARVWKNLNSAAFNHSFDKKVKKVQLGDDLIPDVNQENDVFVVE